MVENVTIQKNFAMSKCLHLRSYCIYLHKFTIRGNYHSSEKYSHFVLTFNFYTVYVFVAVEYIFGILLPILK